MCTNKPRLVLLSLLIGWKDGAKTFNQSLSEVTAKPKQFTNYFQHSIENRSNSNNNNIIDDSKPLTSKDTGGNCDTQKQPKMLWDLTNRPCMIFTIFTSMLPSFPDTSVYFQTIQLFDPVFCRKNERNPNLMTSLLALLFFPWPSCTTLR